MLSIAGKGRGDNGNAVVGAFQNGGAGMSIAGGPLPGPPPLAGEGCKNSCQDGLPLSLLGGRLEGGFAPKDDLPKIETGVSKMSWSRAIGFSRFEL